MKDMLMICPALMSFAAGYFVMKKVEELLGLFRKKRPEGENGKQRKFLYQGLWQKKAG